jgi:hypothetical protein
MLGYSKSWGRYKGAGYTEKNTLPLGDLLRGSSKFSSAIGCSWFIICIFEV